MFKESFMSQEQAKIFLEKMKSDDAFREAVIRIEDVDTKIEYINRNGFSFTSDELEVATFSMID
jgi:predicted ribosomally synthesized peptide with nif11-like leader